MKSVPENENRIILAGDLGMEYYTVDQIFRGFVAPLIIWFLVTIMAVSLFQ